MKNIILSTGILLAIFRSGNYRQNKWLIDSLNVNNFEFPWKFKRKDALILQLWISGRERLSLWKCSHLLEYIFLHQEFSHSISRPFSSTLILVVTSLTSMSECLQCSFTRKHCDKKLFFSWIKNQFPSKCDSLLSLQLFRHVVAFPVRWMVRSIRSTGLAVERLF